MLNKTILTVAILVAIPSAFADTITVRPDHPDQYVVVEGDTLWDISARFLNEPWYWPQIWEGNPQIENPHLIYPGDVIALAYKAGQPVLTVNGGVADSGPAASDAAATSGRTVKLSPKIKAYDRELAIPTIPVDAIRPFLEYPRVVSEDDIDSWPYVVSNIEQSLIATIGNKIYVRGLPDNVDTGRFSIYRKGEALINHRKDKQRILGYEAIYIGDAVLKQHGDPASAVIIYAEREVLEGDRLSVLYDRDINTRFIPRVPSKRMEGNIISVYGADSQIGNHMVIAFDIGVENGLKLGDVLGIYQSGAVVRDRTSSLLKQKREEAERLQVRAEYKAAEDDSFSGAIGGALADVFDGIGDAKRSFDEKFPHISNQQAQIESVTLPDEQAGVVMVFRTFDQISYGLVMESTRPIQVLNAVKNL